MRYLRVFALALLGTLALTTGPLRAQQTTAALRDAALKALKKSTSFYRGQVASHGGYVYYYSVDLKERWGEGKASPDTLFVQPPGTPTVGMAYLKAYEATGDQYYLDATREAAEALVHGQLASGGWAQVIHFARPERGRLGKYRSGRPAGGWNVSSLDDGQTQAALEMLSLADRALHFQHAKIHDAALFGLTSLLQAQFPNGAFPQGWRGPVENHPIVRAKFPDYDWKTEGKIKDYWGYYTLNDNLAGTAAETLITAHQVYKDDKYKAALAKLGDFLILAQMPEPQPGWCQQYNYEMVPIWARKFEPPALTGWESQDVLRTLIRIARYTGDKKYFEPIPRALEYYKRCLLPDGRVARYYELKTNKPLYMDGQYQLTYDDSAVPRHYGWKQPARFAEIEQDYEAARKGLASSQPRPMKELEENVRRLLRDLDAEGRWISTYKGEGLVGQPKFNPGFRYISSAVFSRNVETLSEYLARSSPKAAYDIDNAADVDRAVEKTFSQRRPPMDIPPIAAAWKGIVADGTRPPIKIIYDTDIGTDVDDVIALAFALRRPELKVCGITTSRGEVQQRAAIVSRLLQVMGRKDIPFAPGSPLRFDGTTMRDKPVDQYPFAGPEGDRPRPAFADAQELFRRVIEANKGEVWLVVVGPMTNAAILIRDHPELAAGLKGIVCMGGEPTRAYPEANIANDPAAAELVFRSGLLKFVGTDDVTMRLLMPKPDVDRLRNTDTPLCRALVELIGLWRTMQTVKPGPVVFDLCPLVWLFAPELTTTISQGLKVARGGITVPSADSPPCAVTTDINAVAMHRLLMDTLIR